jgi:ABC-type lipoprotein release transport system permease subunit
LTKGFICGIVKACSLTIYNYTIMNILTSIIKSLYKKSFVDPLSFGKYFTRNILKFIPLFLIISTSIVALTTCIAIADGVIADKNEDLRFYEHFSVLTVKSDKLEDSESYVKKLKTDGLITDYILTRIQYIQTKTIADYTRRPVIGLRADDIGKIKNHLNIKFADEDINETNKVILAEKIVKNKKLKFKDTINSNRSNYEQFMYETYNYSGLIEFSSPEQYINIGITKIKDTEEVSNILILNNKSKMDKLKIEFDNITGKGDKNIMYHSYMSDKYEEGTTSMMALLMFITTVVSIVEIFCVSLLIFMYINSRNEEIGLLMLIGYTRPFVIGKLVIENIVLITVGWLLSWGFSYVVFEYINRLLFAPLYVSQLSIFNIKVFHISLYIPLAVLISTLAVILTKVIKNDALSVFESK